MPEAASDTYPGPRSKRNAFTNRNSHPLLLDLILLNDLGQEYLQWEAETCWREIELTYKTTISEVNKNKIQAIRTCHVSDRPYEAWEIFEKVTIAFSLGVPKFDVIQKPSPHACAATIDTLHHIRDRALSDEVYKYVTAVLLADGIGYAPGVLVPCNRFLRTFIKEDYQKKIKDLLEKGRRPQFDGTQNEDVQVAKSMSVSDFVKFENSKLLNQIKIIFGD